MKKREIVKSLEILGKKAEQLGDHHLASTLYSVGALTLAKEDETLNNAVLDVCHKTFKPNREVTIQ